MKSSNEELMTVKEIQDYFSCSRNTAYKIMNTPGFPSIKVVGKVYVRKEDFEKWLQLCAWHKG